MNFVGEWCKAHCAVNKDCNECSETCFPRFRISEAVGCSEGLIWILMYERDGKTHPEIADAIADFCKATPEQRDSIVAKKYCGTYKPNHKRKFKKQPKPKMAPWNMKAVVAVDKVGTIIRRFESAVEAAEKVGCSPSSINYRCNRYGKCKDEFKPYGMTFRFEAEWLPLTDEERMEDIKAMKGRY